MRRPAFWKPMAFSRWPPQLELTDAFELRSLEERQRERRIDDLVGERRAQETALESTIGAAKASGLRHLARRCTTAAGSPSCT